MGAVAVTAIVTNAATKAPINGLSAINFEGLVAAPDQTGQPVTPLGNGRYLLAFDDTLTPRITLNVARFQPEGVTYTNQASLSFALQPEQGYTAQFQLTSGGPFTAPATCRPLLLSSVPLGFRHLGDSSSSSVNVSAIANGGTDASYVYGAAGTVC